MSSREFGEWVEFAKIEPFGDWRADLRSATICQILANVNRNPKKTKPYRVEDFMPRFERPERQPQSDDEILHNADLLRVALEEATD